MPTIQPYFPALIRLVQIRCTRARHKDHMVIASRVFGVWTLMTNKIIRETSV